MRRKRIAWKLSGATKEIIREMHSSGLTYNEISGYTGVSFCTINNLVAAWNKGLSGLTELADDKARRRGYDSFSDYQDILHYSKDLNIFHTTRGKTIQQKFEEDLEERAERIDIPDEVSQNPDIILDLEEALERLAQRHPREHGILVKKFYEGKTRQEIGDEEGVTGEMIRQLEKKAIEHMGIYFVVLENKKEISYLDEALQRLKQTHPREYRVLVKRFYDDKTLQEIGNEDGVTGYKIGRLEGRAIEYFITYLSGNFKDYLFLREGSDKELLNFLSLCKYFLNV